MCTLYAVSNYVFHGMNVHVCICEEKTTKTNALQVYILYKITSNHTFMSQIIIALLIITSYCLVIGNIWPIRRSSFEWLKLCNAQHKARNAFDGETTPTRIPVFNFLVEIVDDFVDIDDARTMDDLWTRCEISPHVLDVTIDFARKDCIQLGVYTQRAKHEFPVRCIQSNMFYEPQLLCTTLNDVIYSTIVIVNDLLIVHKLQNKQTNKQYPCWRQYSSTDCWISWRFRWINSSSNTSVLVAGNSISVTTPPRALLICGRYRFLVQLCNASYDDCICVYKIILLVQTCCTNVLQQTHS